jgi:hypothetical protein
MTSLIAYGRTALPFLQNKNDLGPFEEANMLLKVVAFSPGVGRQTLGLTARQ